MDVQDGDAVDIETSFFFPDRMINRLIPVKSRTSGSEADRI